MDSPRRAICSMLRAVAVLEVQIISCLSRPSRYRPYSSGDHFKQDMITQCPKFMHSMIDWYRTKSGVAHPHSARSEDGMMIPLQAGYAGSSSSNTSDVGRNKTSYRTEISSII